MLAVIMAGGKGTRIAEIAADIPKPMIPVCGKSVLQHQIEALASQGHTRFLIVVGHLGTVIKQHFKDGAAFGVHIDYWTENEPLGTAGALFQCAGLLDKNFLLLCGDVLFDMDINRFIDFHTRHKALASLAAHPNNHPYDSAILETDEDGRLIGWISKEDPRRYYKNLVNAGIHIVSKELLCVAKPAAKKVDLDRDVLKPNISTGRIFAYNTPEYIKDMGTPDRFYQTEADIQNGIPAMRSLLRKQRAIFLDRDGTLNRLCARKPPSAGSGTGAGAEHARGGGGTEHAPGGEGLAEHARAGDGFPQQETALPPEHARAEDGFPQQETALPPEPAFVTGPAGLALLEGAAEAVRRINASGRLAIVITNQPVIARGICTFDMLNEIHKKLETELGREGAYINDLFFCPHHPAKGFAGEVSELKIDCQCRKPKPGMLVEAARKYNIDLHESWMIGDSFRDVEAGKNAGCRTAYINYDGRDTGADIVVKNVHEAVCTILAMN